jgi:hypothetical protein
MLHHFELRLRVLDDGVEVLPRVGVLLPRVCVREQRKVGREVLEVFRVVRKLRSQILTTEQKSLVVHRAQKYLCSL